MRTLQIPKQKRYRKSRVVTDFCFSDEQDDVQITIHAGYPEFKDESTVYEACLLEIPILKIPEGGLRITASSSETVEISRESEIHTDISGTDFNIRGGKIEIDLRFLKTSPGSSQLRSLPVRTASSGERSTSS